MCKIWYVMGSTCAGKDYFMEMAQEQFPHLVGLVQVGKEFRRRYPPGHFKGSAAPDHTEREALEIFEEQLADAKSKGFKHIFVAGQPRRPSQISPTIGKYPGEAIWVYADKDTLLARAIKRHVGDTDREGYELTYQRITNDKVQLFDVLFDLTLLGVKINPLPTGDVQQAISQIIHFGHL